jgi:hypothetical protein
MGHRRGHALVAVRHHDDHHREMRGGRVPQLIPAAAPSRWRHLNLVAGPLRIADSGHSERDWFLGLAEHHLQQALAFPAPPGNSASG